MRCDQGNSTIVTLAQCTVVHCVAFDVWESCALALCLLHLFRLHTLIQYWMPILAQTVCAFVLSGDCCDTGSQHFNCLGNDAVPAADLHA